MPPKKSSPKTTTTTLVKTVKKRPKAVPLPATPPYSRRGFFKTLIDSIYSPEFYAEIPQRSLGKAMLHLVGVVGMISFLYTVIFVIAFEVKLKPFLAEKTPEIQAIYPEELEITVQEGEVYTNVTEPYFIEFPSFADESDVPYEHFMVIDTQTPFSVQALRDYESMLWLTRDGLVVETPNRTEVFPLNEFGEGTLTKLHFDEGIDVVASVLERMVVPLALIGFLVYWVVIWLVQLLYGLFLALLVWFLSAIWRKEWTYSQSYKVGLHAMTLALFIQMGLFLLILVWPHSIQFPFLFTLLCLLVVGFNLSQQSGFDTSKERV